MNGAIRRSYVNLPSNVELSSWPRDASGKLREVLKSRQSCGPARFARLRRKGRGRDRCAAIPTAKCGRLPAQGPVLTLMSRRRGDSNTSDAPFLTARPDSFVVRRYWFIHPPDPLVCNLLELAGEYLRDCHARKHIA